MDALLKSLEHDAESFRLRKELEDQGFEFVPYANIED